MESSVVIRVVMTDLSFLSSTDVADVAPSLPQTDDDALLDAYSRAVTSAWGVNAASVAGGPLLRLLDLLSLVDDQAAKGNLFGVLGWTWNAKTNTSSGWQSPTGPFGEGGPSGTPTVMGGVLRTWIRSKPGSP